MDNTGYYIYCVIRSSQSRAFNVQSIGEKSSIVHTVTYDNLAAVVSESPIVEYERTRRNMMAHTVVLESIMQDFSILPVSFNTIATSEDAIREQLLKRRHKELCSLLDEMDGHVELGVKAFWYEDAFLRQIVENNMPIRNLRDSLLGKSPDATYYERIRLGEMIEKAMIHQRERDAELLLNALQPLAQKTKCNKILTERMVLNAAFLVKRERESLFDQKVQQLDNELDYLMFKYVGPVPPYNFVTLMVHWD